MSRFLPPAVTTFGLAPRNANDFTGHTISLLSDQLPQGMHFDEGDTEARVPTAFSRAYQFYFSLSKGSLLAAAPPIAPQNVSPQVQAQQAAALAIRESLQQRARHAFRGVLAVFALRRLFAFELAREAAAPLRDQITAGNMLRRMLARQVENDPHTEFWDRLVYFTFKLPTGKKAVLAGASPFTGFFPAARQIEGLPDMLYWYNETEGWLDPGAGDQRAWSRLPPEMQPKLRHFLRFWVAEVLQKLDEGARPMEAELVAMGLTWENTQLLTNEFRVWQQELQQTTAADTAAYRVPPMSVEVVSLGARVAPFLAMEILSSDGFITSLPSSGGRLLVTTAWLLDPETHLYGDVYGSPEFRRHLPALRFEGDDLGLALGLKPNAIPRKFRYLNRLFAPKLARLTEQELGAEWRTLTMQRPGSAADDPAGDKFLYPIAAQALQDHRLEELTANMSVREAADNSSVFEIILQLTGFEVVQRYGDPAFPEFAIDTTMDVGSFDLRLYPNLNLEDIPKEVIPAGSDLRDYFVRLRLSPAWADDKGLAPKEFLVAYRNGQKLRPKEQFTAGSIRDELKTGQERYFASGIANFLRLEQQPDAFYLQDRGFCTVQLPPGPGPNVPLANWAVAVDFGTSNTCVTYRSGRGSGAEPPAVLTFPMLTTSLLAVPEYKPIRGSAEGKSAFLDFFSFDPEGKDIQREEFFPTQICTRLEQPESDEHLGESSLSNGVILFRNLSQIVLQDASIAELLNGYKLPGKVDEQQVRARFRLQQNIKWRPSERWSDVFMYDLRRSIVLTAAKSNARAASLVFSFPKAFTRPEQESFRSLVTSVWQKGGLTPAIMSESEGARNYIADKDWEDCVVLDIGGGTTDVLAFQGKRAFFQMSFRLAADVIDLYVVASRKLREAICDAALEARLDGGIQLRAKLETGLRFFEQVPMGEGGTTPSMDRCQTVWHGLLRQLIGRSSPLRSALCHSVYDSAAPEQKNAITGFFLTALLTFAGLAYLSGLSHRSMRKGGGGGLNVIKLTFIGNGGKYYEFLNLGAEDRALPGLLEELFFAGASGDEPANLQIKCEGVFKDARMEQRPKAAIALGMLTGTASGEKIPVCNTLGERSATIGQRIFTQKNTLGEFYTALQNDEVTIEPDPESGLTRFLAILDEKCQHGHLGGELVVPGLGKAWASDLLKKLERAFQGRLRARLAFNASSFAKNLQNGRSSDMEDVALEPLFITEMSALLGAVREHYAGK